MNKSEKQRSATRHRNNSQRLVRENLRFANQLIDGALPSRLTESLKVLSQEFGF